MVIISSTKPVILKRLQRNGEAFIGEDDMSILKLDQVNTYSKTTITPGTSDEGRTCSYKIPTTPIPTGLGPVCGNMSSTSPLFRQQQQLTNKTQKPTSSSLTFRESPSSAFTRVDRRQSKQNDILDSLRRGSRVDVLGKIGDDDDQSLAPSASSSCTRQKYICMIIFV